MKWLPFVANLIQLELPNDEGTHPIMAILLLQIDEDNDATPLGVYPNWHEAIAAAGFNAFDPDGSSAPLDPSLEPAFGRAFDEAFEPYERATSDEGMDLRWSSGGGWDYRLVSVEIF